MLFGGLIKGKHCKRLKEYYMVSKRLGAYDGREIISFLEKIL
jgi:hypothetical protein